MKILVIGDAMLDLTRFGPRVRTSPEQRSCWVIEETHQEWGLGGAANVARWLAAQPEHEVTLITPLGGEAVSIRFRNLCRANAIRVSERLFDPALRMTVKERILIEDVEKGRSHQCLRVDRDQLGSPRTTDLPSIQHDLWTKGRYDAIVAVDYGKFVFQGDTGYKLAALISAAGAEIPTFVNSKTPARWEDLLLTTLICNQKEMVESLDQHDIRRARSLVKASQFVVTQGAGGVSGFLGASETPIHRLAPAAEIVDVIGCGDAFLAGYVHAATRRTLTGLHGMAPVQFVDLLDEGQRWAAHCLGQVGCGNPLVATEV